MTTLWSLGRDNLVMEHSFLGTRCRQPMFEAMVPFQKEVITGAPKGMKEDIASIRDQGQADNLAISKLQQDGTGSLPSMMGRTILALWPRSITKRMTCRGLSGLPTREFPVFDGSEEALPWLTRVK